MFGGKLFQLIMVSSSSLSKSENILQKTAKNSEVHQSTLTKLGSTKGTAVRGDEQPRVFCIHRFNAQLLSVAENEQEWNLWLFSAS